jgi:hypothetical protein
MAVKKKVSAWPAAVGINRKVNAKRIILDIENSLSSGCNGFERD